MGWWPVAIVGLLILAALVWSIWTEHRHDLHHLDHDQEE